MTAQARKTEDLDRLIAEMDALASSDGPSSAVVIRDSLIGIRDDWLNGASRGVIERRVGGLFRVVSDSEFFGTQLMTRVMDAANEAVGQP